MAVKQYKNKAIKSKKTKLVAQKSFAYEKRVFKRGDEVNIKDRKVLENWKKAGLVKEE